jgi:hypothetical protein
MEADLTQWAQDFETALRNLIEDAVGCRDP